MRDKIFKLVYPWVPVLVFVLLLGATTNFGRLILSEDPELTLANAETISNATDGSLIFSGIVQATKFDLADSASGIDSFTTGFMEDTVINPLVDYTSIDTHTIVVCGWYDTTMTKFNYRGYGDSLQGHQDTLSHLYHKIAPGGDTIIFISTDTLAKTGTPARYYYILFEFNG